MVASGIQSFDAGTVADLQADRTAEYQGPPRTVLITGISRGLGHALATKLVELGHTVIGCSRTESAVAELRTRWGPPHRFDVVDVCDEVQVRAWADALEAHGQVPDLLINNAAVTHRPAQIWRLSTQEFADVLKVNVLGVVNVLRHFVPAMLKRGTGIIVNFSSGWGREAAARVGPYCASKWAVEGLTRVLAAELPPKMAAVSLHPGIVNTDALRQNFGAAADKYPSPEQWVQVAAPYILNIRPRDNGKALSVPGMTEFRGWGPSR
ncbi:MAG: SDR family oxidoreductase [Planctomycetes bacterium]|nr:SDR family oxidoreductase [Planctomycetota bacterium]